MVERFLKIEYLFFLFLLGISWGQDWVKAGDWTRNGKILFFVLGLGMIGARVLYDRFHASVALFYLGIMGQWFLLRAAPVSMIEILTINGTIFLSMIIVSRPSLVETFCLFMVVDGIFQATLSISEVAGFRPFLQISYDYADKVWWPMALHGHPTLVGPYLAACLPFVFLGLNGKWRYISSALIITAIVLCQSTMSILSLAASVTVLAGFYFGKNIFFSIVGLGTSAVAGLAALFPNFSSLTGRWDHWVFAWNNLVWPGFGAGTWMPTYWQYTVAQMRAAERGLVPMPSQTFFAQLHNDYLQGAFEFGIIMVFVLWALIEVARRTLCAMNRRDFNVAPFACAAASIALNALGNFPMHVFPLGFVCGLSILFMLKKPPSDLEALN